MVTTKQTKRQGDVMYATRGGSQERERTRMETSIVFDHHIDCFFTDTDMRDFEPEQYGGLTDLPAAYTPASHVAWL